MTWTAKIVEVDASKTVVRTLGRCNIGEVPEEPVNPRGDTFVPITIPKYEEDRSGLGGVDEVGQYDDVYIGRHIQIFDGATLRFEGVPMKENASSGDGAVTIPVYDQGWYLTKSNIDAPVRNLLSNGQMESGTTGWTASSVTETSATDLFRRGSKGLRLVGATAGADQYAYQQVAVTGTAVGTVLTVAAWYQIESWTDAPLGRRALFIESLAPGPVVETFNDEDGAFPSDDDLVIGEWVRVEATTWVPPGATRTIEVRLYAPQGSIVWDAVELVEPTSLAIAPGSGEDIAYTANRIVQFIQDPTYGKSDKQIGTTTAPTTGIKFLFPKAYLFSDHTPADTALEEIVNLGVDYSIHCTTGVSTFTVHYPEKGSDLTATVELVFPAPTSPASGQYGIAEYTWDGDHDAIETESFILGEGDGPDREEGYATDTSDAAGMVLQGVENAPPGTTIDKLDDLAAARVTLRKRPVRQVKLTTKGAVSVTTGDRVTLTIDDGVIQVPNAAKDIGDTWRIIGMDRLPRTNGCLTLTLEEYL